MSFKRIVSILLAVCLVFGMLPAAAQAATVEPGSSDAGVMGTGGFGTLLSDAVHAQQLADAAAQEDFAAGYSVTELEIQGNTAVVTYSALSEATLVVGIYSEDGLQLLLSGTASVQPEQTAAVVELEGKMPEYFRASAYLLDNSDLTPLCPAYDTPMYTREMRELLASTVADYDADRVLNLDTDEETNFAVYAESTKLIAGKDGFNTVIQADDEAAVYVIGNADEQITSLQQGDVFAYAYGGNEILLVKVLKLSLDGTTATITGAELQMDEVFSHVKIESSATAADAVVDTSESDPGVTCAGRVPGGMTRSGGENVTMGTEVSFDLNIADTGGDDKKITVKGGLTLSVEVTLDFYITGALQRLELQVQVGVKGSVTVEGEYGGSQRLKLAGFVMPMLPTVNVRFVPSFVLRLSGSAQVSFGVEAMFGGVIQHGENGFQVTPLSKKPDGTLQTKFEGQIFCGVELKPQVEVLGGTIAVAGVSAEAGVSAKIQEKQELDNSGDVRHDCFGCLEGDLSVELKASAEAKFFNSDKLKISADLVKLSLKLGDFYICLSHMVNFAWGICPHYSYRIVLNAVDQDDQPVTDAVFTVVDEERTMELTLGHGGQVFLTRGHYIITAVGNGTSSSRDLHVQTPQKLTFLLEKKEPEPPISIPESMLPQLKDDGAADTGSTGTGIRWRFYPDGTLHVMGSGVIPDCRGGAPWKAHTGQIKRLVIHEGITAIGQNAFYKEGNLMSVQLPGGLARIEANAFYECGSLTEINLPDGLVSIGYGAFESSGLTGVTTPASLESIGINAFRRCAALTTLELNGTRLRLGQEAFYQCENLRTVVCTGDVMHLGALCFEDCTSLVSVKLPETLETVDQDVFEGCSQLTTINIPGSLTELGVRMFSKCTSLTAITLPDTLTSIGLECFQSSGLTSITTPKSLKSIGISAFYRCGNLTTANLYGTDLKICDSAFRECTALTDLTLHDGVQNLDTYAFLTCTALTRVSMPSSVTVTGASVFKDCKALTYVALSPELTELNNYIFSGCEALSSLTIPGKVERIGPGVLTGTAVTDITLPASVRKVEAFAFDGCKELKTVRFLGDAPSLPVTAFNWLTLTVYYPAGGSGWAGVDPDSFTGEITMRSYTPSSGSARSIHGGDYTTQTTPEGNIKTASFRDLVPGGEYLLLALVRTDTQQPLAADNLLYIDQGQAAADGTLVFHYMQRIATQESYVLVIGPSGKDLKQARISWEPVDATGQPQMLSLDVRYDGELLREGRDYMLTGAVSILKPGTYTCRVQGMGSYTGVAEYTYTVSLCTHTYTAVVTDPTCEAGGYTTHTCACGESYVTDYVDALGHSYGLWIIDTESVLGGTAGAKHRVCECGQTEYETYTNPLIDVPNGKYFSKPVFWAYENGITKGKTATEFQLDADCTRKQIVMFLWRAAGEPEPQNMENPFVDVKADSFEKAILWAYYEGITSGKTATEFQPEAPCTREQIVMFLWRYFGKPEPESMVNPFTDVRIGGTFEKAILWAYYEGITTGKTATTFEPQATCTRGQIVTFLYRAMVE